MWLRDQIIKHANISNPTALLLYSTQNSDYHPYAFHTACDYFGPTLTLYGTTEGYVFGGYTSLSWTSLNYSFYDKDAFIFSLTKGTVHLQKGESSMSVIQGLESMPSFGNGDIKVDFSVKGGNLYYNPVTS